MEHVDATETTRDEVEPLKYGYWNLALFFGLHLTVGLVYWAGVSWSAVLLCLGSYYLRMFAITAGYHRYFSHRAFRTGRVFQFFLAFLGSLALQKGPLWWAAHHRHHHQASDEENDIHSPRQQGLLWAHLGWILCSRYEDTDLQRIQDFARYPELRWLNRHHLIPFVTACVLVLSLAGFQALVWGCFVSTILLYHGTFSINSLMHVIGKRVYDTGDDSKNSFVLALVTMGEGWHNNHHYYRASANQGFRWYEIDLTFYILVVLEKLGVIWDVKRAPRDVIEGRRSVRKRPVRGLRRDSVAGPGGQSHAPVAVGLDPGGVSAQAAGRPKETVSV